MIERFRRWVKRGLNPFRTGDRVFAVSVSGMAYTADGMVIDSDRRGAYRVLGRWKPCLDLDIGGAPGVHDRWCDYEDMERLP